MRPILISASFRPFFAAALVLSISSFVLAQAGTAVTNGGLQDAGELNLTITKVDDVAVKDVLKPNGKPLLVNFWATWCEPCRVEFPDLVSIDADYKGKIDFRIISLDDPVEINGEVPKFLKDMGSTMKPYLLRTDDETAVIGAISDDWQGGLPFTVLYDAEGNVRHARQGKIRVPIVRAILDQLLAPPNIIAVTEFVKVLNGRNAEAAFYYRNNWMRLREEAVKRGIVDSYELQFAEPLENDDYDIVLITRYKDEAQYAAAEKNFTKLIEELSPEGPMLVSSLKPAEFRKSLTTRVSRSIFLDR